MLPPVRAFLVLALLSSAPSFPAGPQARVLRIDPAASRAGFELEATMHTVHGESRAVDGEVKAVFEADGSVRFDGRVLVAVASLDTGNARRDKKMRAESLEVARFPSVVFEPATLDPPAAGPEPSGASRQVLHGRLTIRDVTKPIVLDVRVARMGDRFTVTGGMDVVLADYGIPDPSVLLLRVAKVAKATFEIVFIAAAGA